MKPGAILLSGKNITENQILTETYLYNIWDNIVINNKIHENIETKISSYLKNTHVNNFEILKYIETTSELLKLENINILGEWN